MTKDERIEALRTLRDKAESVTDYLLLEIAGYEKPWSTVTVIAILAFAVAVGGYLF